MFYKQVRMVNANGEVHVAWVPEEFAKIGKMLSYKESDHGWSHSWEVTDVWSRASEEYVVEHERDYKTQSQASDKVTKNKGLFK